MTRALALVTAPVDGPMQPRQCAGLAECPCGWPEERPRHAHHHLTWATGVPVGPAIRVDDPTRPGITVVSPRDRAPLRHLAYQAARHARADQGWDFASFPFLRDDTDPTRALLYHCRGRVRGYLATRDGGQECNGRWSLCPDEQIVRDSGPPLRRPNVALIWVAADWRRSGVASALVRHLAARAGVATAALMWEPPFTPAGEALAARFAGRDGAVWVP